MASKPTEEHALAANRVFVLTNARDRKASPVSRSEAASVYRDSLFKVTPQTCCRESMGNVDLLNPRRELSGEIWHEVPGGLPVVDDLSSAVIQALDRFCKEDQSSSITAFELTPVGLNIVNGRYAPPSGNPNNWNPEDSERYRANVFGISVSLSIAARQRLGTPSTELIAVIQRVIAVFPSQFCIVIAELEILGEGDRQASPAELEEVLHVISNRKRGAVCGMAAVRASSGIDLQHLLLNMLPTDRFEARREIRLFTHTALTLESFPADVKTVAAIAFRCAHHYTADYSVDYESVAADIYMPFKSILHDYALEGAASVCDGSDEFLREQFLTRIRQGYLWLTVLAYHEHSYLQWLLSRGSDRSLRVDETSDDLGALIHEFLRFRLKHNIPLVSHIGMHNQAYHRLRQRMFLNELIQKVTCDVVEVERWLAQRTERRRTMERDLLEKEKERRKAWRLKFAWGEILVSGFLMFGLTFLAFDALTRKVSQIFWNAEPPHFWGIFWPVGIGLVAAALRGWQVRSEIYEEPVSEALLEAVTTGDAVETKAAVGFIAASNISQTGQL